MPAKAIKRKVETYMPVQINRFELVRLSGIDPVRLLWLKSLF